MLLKLIFLFFFVSISVAGDNEKLKKIEQREKEVKNAQKLKKASGTLMVTGGVLIGFGLVLILTDDTEPEENKFASSPNVEKKSGQSALGGGMAMVGISSILLGWILKISANSILEKDQGDLYQLSKINLKASRNSLKIIYDF